MKKLVKKSVAALAALALLVCAVPAPADAADEPVRIAFIDSGISTKHIDASRVEAGKNYVFPDADTQDRIGHGTATASLVLGAEDQGVRGVFPDAVAVPLTVVDKYPAGAEKNGGPAALCEAIRDAVDEFGCRIVNISLAVAEDSEALREAVAYAESRGAVLVSVTGNDGASGVVYYPGAYASVIAVGSADGESAAPFSQNGADVLARGVGLTAASNRNGAAPATVSGTSYSCAIVSGFCAKLWAAYPSLSPAELRQALYALARDVMEPGFDVRSGWGLVDAERAIPFPYLDVPADTWCYPAICGVTEKGLMNGTGGGRFTPEGTMTRAMLAAVLWRMAGEPDAGGESPFADVAEGAYYTAAVVWAADAGIIAGYEDGRFGTDDPVTREQLVTMLWRAAGRPAAENDGISAFTDADAVSAWARDALAWAVGSGVINGKGDGILAPGDAAARAEVAQILMRSPG